MKEHLGLFRQTIEKVIDKETGEELSTDVMNHQYLVGKPEEFYLVYNSLLNILAKWELSVSDLNLYSYLCVHYANGSIFNISESIKKEVGELNKKQPSSFNNSTRALLSIGLIVKVANKTYKLNPRYIYKGSSKNRSKALFEILQVDKNA